MEDAQVGWIAAIRHSGGAEQFMKSNMGMLADIMLGIVGAAAASFQFGLLGIRFGSDI